MHSKRLLKSAIFLLFIFMFCQRSYASHLMGADISYSNVGPDSFKVRLSLYRDCGGIGVGDTAGVIVASNSCGVSINIKVVRVAGVPIEIDRYCSAISSTCTGGAYPGVQEYVFEGFVKLPMRCTDWIISFATCCRNAAITTISAPSSSGFYIEAKLNNVLAPSNNSPNFTTLPVPIACNHFPFIYNHGIAEIDGDSIYFSLEPCRKSAMLSDSVIYLPSFNPLYPIACSSPFVINHHTGDVSFTPNGIQVGIFKVLVREYRSGLLVGSAERDIQLTINTCTNGQPYLEPLSNLIGASATASGVLEICAGDSVYFTICGLDSIGNDSLQLHSNFSSFSPRARIINLINDTGIVCSSFIWNTNLADMGLRTFTVEVSDDHCPISRSALQTYYFNVVPCHVTIAGADTLYRCQSNVDSIVLTAYGSITGYHWSVLSGDSSSLSCDTCSVIRLLPSQTTIYEVEGTSISSVNKDTLVIFLASDFSLSTNFTDTIVCRATPLRLDVLPSGIDTYYYEWFPAGSFTDRHANNPLVLPLDNIDYIVTVSNSEGLGCHHSDTIHVHVNGKQVVGHALICSGMTFIRGLRSYSHPGIFADTFAGLLGGCDSVFILNLSEDTSVRFLYRQADTLVCAGARLQLNTVVQITPIVRYDTIDRCSNYQLENVAFNLLSVSRHDTVMRTGDDVVTSAIPIGFNFNFFCANYDQLYISSNGFITFSAGSPAGSWSGQILPNLMTPNNLIACGWADYDLTRSGTISTFLQGTAPNRIFAINFNAVPHFFTYYGDELTTQILLYESSNIIDINTSHLRAFNIGSNNGHTFGLENASGHFAVAVPGKNSTENFLMNNISYRFTPTYFVDTVVEYPAIDWYPNRAVLDSTVVNPFIIPSDSTTYRLSIYDGSCFFDDTIVVLTSGRVDTTSRMHTICNGDTIVEDGRTFFSSGVYTYFLTNSSGCDSILIYFITVTTIDRDLSFIGSSLISNQPAATYQWVQCDSGYSIIAGETAQSYIVTEEGSYAVIISIGPCIDTSDCVFVGGLGMSSIIAKDLISVYPNPANNLLHIEYQSSYSFELLDLFGHEIFNGKSETGKAQINLGELSEGIYLVKITINGYQYVYRINKTNY